MWISRKKWEDLEKRVAALERDNQERPDANKIMMEVLSVRKEMRKHRKES